MSAIQYFRFLVETIEHTRSYSASRETLSLNLAKHVKASCSWTSAVGASEKDRWVIAPFKQPDIVLSWPLYIRCLRESWMLPRGTTRDYIIPEAEVRSSPNVTWYIFNEESVHWINYCGRGLYDLRIDIPMVILLNYPARDAKMALDIPVEVLYMILDQLRDERDYNTIYQCALSSKYFTELALTILYQYVPTWSYGVHIRWLGHHRLYDTAPVTGGGGTEDEQIKARRTGGSVEAAKWQQERTIWKWAVMWRSVILSALDQTYLPYCSFIRYLNLEDLSELLSHSGFKGKTHE